jgi:hypothetical protein
MQTRRRRRSQSIATQPSISLLRELSFISPLQKCSRQRIDSQMKDYCNNNVRSRTAIISWQRQTIIAGCAEELIVAQATSFDPNEIGALVALRGAVCEKSSPIRFVNCACIIPSTLNRIICPRSRRERASQE